MPSVRRLICGVAALTAVAAGSCALPGIPERPPDLLAGAPAFSHAGAEEVVVSWDGRVVVGADPRGGLTAFEVAGGTTTVLRTPPADPSRVVHRRLDFTSDGILVGLPWTGEGAPDLVGLRAGTWTEVVVAEAPRSIDPWHHVLGLPEAGLPATEVVLPGSGWVLGLRGRPEPAGTVAESPPLPATQAAFDRRSWTVWEAATGREVRTLPEFPVAARPSAAFADGESVVATQFHVVTRIDLRAGRRIWWADPLDTRSGAPPDEDLAALLAWAARARAGAGAKGATLRVVGVSSVDDRVVVEARRSGPETPGAGETDGAPRGTPEFVALRSGTGEVAWRWSPSRSDAAAWVVPRAGALVVCERGMLRRLDLRDGTDVTPPGWTGARPDVRAAASDPGKSALWVALADGRIGRLTVPPVAR